MKRLKMLAVAAVAALEGPALADVVIPSSAFSSGRNNALFQSDVRIFNPTSSPVLVTPIFYDPTTGAADARPPITLPARTQTAYDNILQSLFGKPLGTFGPIRFQTTAAIIVSSNVNNTNGCGNGSVSGQWLPGVDVAKGQKSGTLVSLAASADGSTGFRSNIDFVNVDPGGNANVTVKIRKGDGSQLSSATLSPLAPNTLFQKAIDDVTFPGVAGTTDRNLWLEFTSDRPVIAFASVISNASGDPFAIVMTPEPVAPVPAPVAGFTFSPASPQVNQVVTFTDSSTGSPTQQLWAFGDGTTATSGATTTRTYAAAGTYKASHFVTNESGASVATKDVVVAAVQTGPIDVTINMKQWAFEPNAVTFEVGKTYRITFKAVDVTHGVGGLAQLGLIGCGTVISGTTCVANFTPTASMVRTQPYSMECSRSECGAGHDTMRGTITIKNP